jgi:hypothetical protein
VSCNAEFRISVARCVISIEENVRKKANYVIFTLIFDTFFTVHNCAVYSCDGWVPDVEWDKS